MNVKEIKPKGILRSFKSSIYEVTAAIEETEPPHAARTVAPAPMQTPTPPVPVSAPGNINVAIDEPIPIPRPEEVKETFASVENAWASYLTQEEKEEPKKEIVMENNSSNNLEEKLENLQSLLEKKLAQPVEEQKEELPKDAPMDENLKFVKMIYGILLENEVDEKYVNQIMDEVEKVMKKGASVDYILSSIYQKMILKFGQPQPIQLSEQKPRVVFFIGPTRSGRRPQLPKLHPGSRWRRGRKWHCLPQIPTALPRQSSSAPMPIFWIRR